MLQLLSSMDHPNIIKYYDSFLDSEGALCIATTYCEGEQPQQFTTCCDSYKVLCIAKKPNQQEAVQHGSRHYMPSQLFGNKYQSTASNKIGSQHMLTVLSFCCACFCLHVCHGAPTDGDLFSRICVRKAEGRYFTEDEVMDTFIQVRHEFSTASTLLVWSHMTRSMLCFAQPDFLHCICSCAQQRCSLCERVVADTLAAAAGYIGVVKVQLHG
jgi:hypothetical protein